MNVFWLCCVGLLVLGVVPVADTAITVPRWVSDHVVLQTNREYGSRAFINGKADAREQVLVQVGGDKYPATADSDGEWEVEIRSPFGNVSITGESGPPITATDVQSGDLLFCSGQSNMVFPLELAFNVSDEIATLSKYPDFRFFMTALDYSSEPMFDLKPDPSECTSTNKSSCAMSCAVPGMCNRWVTAAEAMANNGTYLKKFSAVCFMTARDIANMHTGDRPLGLVFSAWGGTRVEAWMSTEAIEDAKSRVDMTPPPMTQQNNVSVLYNAMVAPFNKLSIRASLWYQGEANADEKQNPITPYYAEYLQAMIRDWRNRKGMGDVTFLPMMLPPSLDHTASTKQQLTTGRPELRLAQVEVAPHSGGETDISGVPVTIDLGGKSGWGFDHPPNKNEMSRRLALQTVHSAYAVQGRIHNGGADGSSDSLWTGPVFDSATTAGTTVTVSFEAFSAEGLSLQDVHAKNIDGSDNSCIMCCKQQQPFEVLVNGAWARPDFAALKISSSSISFSSGSTTATAVRYAFQDYVGCVVVNSDGLPLAPLLVNITTASQSSSLSINAVVANGAKDMPIVAPPMGFNSWNFYHCNIDENIVKAMADRFVSSGMAAVNYSYINIDDCWQVARDSVTGSIIADPVRFPSGMKALTDYVHSKGLKFGLYTARGSGTCQSRPGSLGHELIDAATYCAWGIDYIKIDACKGAKDAQTSWTLFHQGLSKCYNDTGQYIVQSVESCDNPNVCGQWVTSVANLWRTGGDVQNTWESVQANIHHNDIMKNIAVPGHFNDPDMLQVGNVGLTPDEQRSHFALWAMASAPLLVGTDIIHASNQTIEILTAVEVIAVNQDLGINGRIQGYFAGEPGVNVTLFVDSNKAASPSMGSEIWMKQMSTGRTAIMLVNGDPINAADLTVTWAQLNITGSQSVRDLRERKELGTFSSSYTAKSLAPHASVIIAVTPATA